MEELAKKERFESEAIEQKSTMLTAQLLWACHAWNVTPLEAAQQVVAALFDLLARGGSVPVRIEELGGRECVVEVTATRQ